MKHLAELAKTVFEISTKPIELTNLMNEERVKAAIQDHIYYTIDDVLKIVSNILKTSLNSEDKRVRLLALEEKSGIRGIYDKFG